MASKVGLLSINKFGKLIGRTGTAVRFAIKRGRIQVQVIEGRKYIDPETAVRDWERNTDKIASQKALKNVGKKPGPKPQQIPYKPERYQGLTTADAERREKVYKSRLSELKYLEQAGELVNIKDVKKQAFEAARKVRDAIMNIPARLCHELAAETDPHVLENRLAKELAQALESLARAKR